MKNFVLLVSQAEIQTPPITTEFDFFKHNFALNSAVGREDPTLIMFLNNNFLQNNIKGLFSLSIFSFL